MEDMTIYRNFRIFNSGSTFIVRADSKRFGKSSIVYENYDLKQCVSWIYAHYRNKSGKIITNTRHQDHVYCKAMETCNVQNNPWYKAKED